MNTFDERMRARAHTEDCPVPAGFEHRLSAALEELPAGKANIAGRSRPVTASSRHSGRPVRSRRGGIPRGSDHDCGSR